MAKLNDKQNQKSISLTEKRVREIVREEINKYMGEKAIFNLTLKENDREIFKDN